MIYESMHLTILLPFSVFAEMEEVERIVVETPQGAFGLLPNRLDGVAALTPGILTYQVRGEEEAYVAIDKGILVKAGAEVQVSVRNAIGDLPLGKLQDAIQREFLALREREEDIRSVMTKLEVGFIRRLQKLQHT